jgi:hypothetical protein
LRKSGFLANQALAAAAPDAVSERARSFDQLTRGLEKVASLAENADLEPGVKRRVVEVADER